jgi:hypothetical protein
MSSPHPTMFVVTQIRLDTSTSSDEFIPNSVRPSWIRPARKKNPPVPRSIPGPCMESPPQNMSEFASDHISFAQVSTPFSPITDFSPVMFVDPLSARVFNRHNFRLWTTSRSRWRGGGGWRPKGVYAIRGADVYIRRQRS